MQLRLPKNQRGGQRRVDDRHVISGIFYELKRGCRWIDCLADEGLPPSKIYKRFSRL